MKIIYNKFIPFKGFKAINLFGVLFVRNGATMKAKDLNHEAIHTAQMKEMWYIPFYIWYGIEWLVNLVVFFNAHQAYRAIKFEREAYDNEKKSTYLSKRNPFAWYKL